MLAYLRYRLFLFALIGAVGLPAQTVLLNEDFNTCALPADWQVRLSGDHLSPLWYVGLAQHSAVSGQSIDGSCFLFMDDDAGGIVAPGYVLEFVSPAFDATPFTTVECQMDVYFRFGASDFLQIIATDGQTETVLARYDNFTTNYEGLDQGDFFKFRNDLAFVPHASETRLIIRYTSPPGSKGLFAGIDNIRVTGSGAGVNVLLEGFDDCQQPDGWETKVVSGPADWMFGRVPLGSSAFYEGNTMNGTCFVFFDDNAQGDSAAPTHIRLRSPWFSGTEFFEYELTFDAIMRYSGSESFALFLENDQGAVIPLFQPEGKVAGPFFPDYGAFRFDLTPYRSAQLRLLFEYNDGGAHGYWVGVDNVKVTGRGPAFDFCQDALPLLTGAPCMAADNETALFNGPPVGCAATAVGGLWFRWTADFTGIAKLTTRADFNDVVNVFAGTCGDPQPLLCNNRDEHGFTGETTHFAAQQGVAYFFRISGQEGGFGLPRGHLCIGIEKTDVFPVRPANDDCATAHLLAPDNPCGAGNNRNATMSPYQPTHNRLARADVWYYFTAPVLMPGEALELDANANFSHLITLYQGTCAALTEIATNHHGGTLTMPALVPGQTYFAQIAGSFATVEGDLCPQLRISKPVPPDNDNCPDAPSVALNAPCLPATNVGATFSGRKPACALAVDRDVWFVFQAPAFGSVQVSTGARFEHVLAVWEDTCDSLRPVFCHAKPQYCDGYTTVPNLNNGQTYYLQIAARSGTAGLDEGAICLKIRDGALPSDFTPLTVEVAQLCIGADSAKLFATPSGGTPPYAFLADTVGQILAGGAAFGVVVQDAVGCQALATGIGQVCAESACTGLLAIDPVLPSCFGAADGVLSAGMVGGTGPFFFEWSNQVFTANNANLPAGAYALTVSDATGCTYTAQVVLTQPDSLVALVASVQHPVQGQSNGSVQVQVFGGTPPVVYSWFLDANFITSDLNLSGVPGGGYTLYVMDANDCWDSLSVTLIETVGTRAATEPFGVSVFPNPASERLWVAVALPAPQTLDLLLTDVLGRPLVAQRQTLAAAQARLDLVVGHLPAGTYLLHLQAEGQVVTRRVVVGR